MQEQFEQVRTLEVALTTPAVRADKSRLDALLHPEFYEIGRSGRRFSKSEILTMLPEEARSDYQQLDFQYQAVNAHTMLLSYCSIDNGELTQRTSLWVEENGRWRVRFHQGTPAAPIDNSDIKE